MTSYRRTRATAARFSADRQRARASYIACNFRSVFGCRRRMRGHVVGQKNSRPLLVFIECARTVNESRPSGRRRLASDCSTTAIDGHEQDGKSSDRRRPLAAAGKYSTMSDTLRPSAAARRSPARVTFVRGTIGRIITIW
jgi:hypothetical protein